MFDSGVGGLTVLREVQKHIPDAHFIYFGDTARCPYGPKSDKTIIRYSVENGIFLIDQGVELLIVACHTASALALEKLRSIFQIPVLGVIEPAVESACKATRSARIGVIGTKATIQSGVYQKEILKILPESFVATQACPLFVPLVEEQFINKSIQKEIVKEYLVPLKEQQIDTLLLGCTHYPLLQEIIQEEMGKEVTLINPAEALAKKIASLKKQDTLLACDAPKQQKSHLGPPIQASLFVSDDPERFQKIGEHFFGHPLPCAQLVTSLL